LTLQVLHALVEQALHPDPSVRRSAVRDLGKYANPEAIDALVQRLADPVRSVADGAVHSLLQIGTDSVAYAIIPLLTHEEISQRSLALDVLMGLGRAAGPAMVNLLEHPDRELRKTASEVLTASGYVEACPALMSRLADPDPVVRAAIVSALAALGCAKAVPDLVARWRVESVEWVRFSLASALCQLGTPEMIEELLEQEADGAIRDMVLQELARRQHGRASR
jgi:HEAT repeat protein